MDKVQMDGYTPRMKKHYDEVVRPALVKEFGYTNPMQVPKIEKITLNMGVVESTGVRQRPSARQVDHPDGSIADGGLRCRGR